MQAGSADQIDQGIETKQFNLIRHNRTLAPQQISSFFDYLVGMGRAVKEW